MDKTKRFWDYIEANPGCSTAELHDAVGREYAGGRAEHSYGTVERLRQLGVLRCHGVARGGRGVGLYTTGYGRQAVEAMKALETFLRWAC